MYGTVVSGIICVAIGTLNVHTWGASCEADGV